MGRRGSLREENDLEDATGMVLGNTIPTLGCIRSLGSPHRAQKFAPGVKQPYPEGGEGAWVHSAGSVPPGILLGGSGQHPPIRGLKRPKIGDRGPENRI